MKSLLLIASLALPIPVEPQNDPAFDHCLTPEDAVELRWTSTPEPDVTTWLLIKRRDDDGGGWRTWVKSYVSAPPFTLNMRSAMARSGDFAWSLFSVDRAAQEYAVGEWRYFCTREPDEPRTGAAPGAAEASRLASSAPQRP